MDEHNLRCSKILLNNRKHLFTLRVTEQASCRTCEHMLRGAHAGADILIGLVSPWEIQLAHSVSKGLYPLEMDQRTIKHLEETHKDH